MTVSNIILDISFSYPRRRLGSVGEGPCWRRPRAEVTFNLEEGGRRSCWVPVRVARLFEKNLPDVPCELGYARDMLRDFERRLCFTMLTEAQSRREHSTEELRRKLSEYGYRDSSIDAALERACELAIANNDRFAVTFIEERVRRGWGRRKVELELRRRGIDPADVPGYPDRYFTVEDDFERALGALLKKRVPEQRAYEKFVRFLIGKGFSYDIASRAAKERISRANEA